MDLGTYIDAQGRLLGAGYVITYQAQGSAYPVPQTAYRVTIMRGAEHHHANGLLSHATVRLADRYAKGAK